MLREISEEVRVNLKDRLREARHLMRQHRHDSATAAEPGEPAPARPPFPLRGIEDLLGHAVSAFDDAMGIAQTLVPRTHSHKARTARSLAAYFPVAGGDMLAAERAFRRDMYDLVRIVLARRKLSGVLVHEADFVAIHAAMRRRHQPLLADLGRDNGWAGKTALAAGLSAALLDELLAHRPLRLGPTRVSESASGVVDAEAAIACLAPVALACGLATVDPDGSTEPDLVEMAMLATDARIERIRQACAGADRQGELTTLFAMLLAHLP